MARGGIRTMTRALSVSRNEWISTIRASASDLTPTLDGLGPKSDRGTGRRLGRRSGPSERTGNATGWVDQRTSEQPLPPLRARPLVRARCEGPVAGRSPTGALYR